MDRPWYRALISPTRAAVIALVVAAIATRALLIFSAVGFPAKSDVETAYRPWAVQVLEDGGAPYEDVDIEYPPASLPFVLGPELSASDERGYRVAFVTLMLCADVAGIFCLIVLGRRRKSLLGAWIWTIAIALLGPLVYLRLDLVPAVATIWLVERADSDDWLGAGGLLGLAIATKGYAVVLIPVALFVCPPRSRPRLGAGLAAALGLSLLPFITKLGAVYESVVGYHSARGIQIESLWGSLLFILRSFDRLIVVTHNYGAHHFEGGTVPVLKLAASAAVAGVTVAGTWLAVRSRRSSIDLAATAFVTITLVVAVASVFSPQFMIWIIALGAAAACFPDTRVAAQALLLVPVAAITRLIYPTLHPGLIRAESVAIITVWFRNLMLLVTGIYAAVRHLEGSNDPSTPEGASEGTQ